MCCTLPLLAHVTFVALDPGSINGRAGVHLSVLRPTDTTNSFSALQTADRRKLLLNYVQQVEPSVMQKFEDGAAPQVVTAMRQVRPGPHGRR